ncbi:MAG: hypothetical protein LBD57_06250 [Endomicrobium sp.]|uniref:hypothetical protein n=1 Tax=Candidatus Endomicrobiellum cubanum TaxID=3242325 RepID=UPI00281B6B36|nr:hypothetical protein [Endomicrobium sp.]
MKNIKALLNLKIVDFGEFKHCLLNKYIIVSLIVFCMTINGFIPKNVDINKNNLVLVVALATHSAVVDVFKRCNDSLIIISNKISKDLQKLLFQTRNASDMPAQKNHQNDSKDDSTTNNNVVVINTNLYNNKVKKIFFENTLVLNGIFISITELFKLYMNYKISSQECANKGMIFLMFVVFIFAIRQRKVIVSNAFFYKLFLLENKNLGIKVTNVPRFLFS